MHAHSHHSYLFPLDAIAKQDGRNLVAGINGGYFWRVDVSSFFDTVCLFKWRTDALEAVSPTVPNAGVADGAIVADGAWLGSNCDCAGFSRPAVLTLNGTSSRVDVVTRGELPPYGTAYDAISAGPSIVTHNASGVFVGVPAGDDNIGNILEHSANTGFGMAANGTAFLVTFDGSDGCSFLDPTCGTNACVCLCGNAVWIAVATDVEPRLLVLSLLLLLTLLLVLLLLLLVTLLVTHVRCSSASGGFCACVCLLLWL